MKRSVFSHPKKTVWVMENVPDHATGYVIGVYRSPSQAMKDHPAPDWEWVTRYVNAPYWWSTEREAQIEEHEVL